MAKRLLLAALAGLGLAVLVDAAPPAAPSAADPLDRIVEQLGDVNFRKRDEAERRLRDEGARAVLALRRALGHPDAEVRRRAADLIPAIETATLLAPRRVTLKVVNKPVRDVCAEITRQTGLTVHAWPANPEQVYSFDFQGLSFWEAIDRIGHDAGLVVQAGYGDNGVRLQQQAGQPAHVRYDGAFRFTANSFQHYRNIDFSLVGPGTSANRSETLTFTFTLFVEPRLPLLGVGEARLTAAYDNERNSMVPARAIASDYDGPAWRVRRRYSRYGSGNRTTSLQAQVQLVRPSEKATAVKLLRGAVPVTLLTEQKTVVVTDQVLTAKGKKVRVGDTSFEFQEITKLANGQYQLRMMMANESKDNPRDYTWMNSLYQRIQLLDEKGQPYQVFSTSWGGSDGHHVTMTLTYGPNGGAKLTPPARFVFQQWDTMQHLVPFEFHNLPLP